MANSALSLLIAASGLLMCLSACDNARVKEVAAPRSSETVTKSVDAPVAARTQDGASVKARCLPRIARLQLLPRSPLKTDELVIQAAADEIPGTPVDFNCQWSVNGRILTYESRCALKNAFVKGDRINVTVTPEAGGVCGSPLIQTTVISNSPPVVKPELAEVKITGNKYSYRVQAEDPDGDPLVYAILKGPKNMTIDRGTGVIFGEYLQEEAGKHDLSISVKDSDNAEVVLNISLQLGSAK